MWKQVSLTPVFSTDISNLRDSSEWQRNLMALVTFLCAPASPSLSTWTHFVIHVICGCSLSRTMPYLQPVDEIHQIRDSKALWYRRVRGSSSNSLVHRSPCNSTSFFSVSSSSSIIFPLLTTGTNLYRNQFTNISLRTFPFYQLR